MSPYMIGPYYKPQLTSMLSILSRLTGVFLTVVSTPVALAWVLALAMGPETFAQVQDLMGGIVGKIILLASLFSLCYHLANGIRHLIWDTGAMLEIDQVYRSGYIMVGISVALFILTWWAAS